MMTTNDDLTRIGQAGATPDRRPSGPDGSQRTKTGAELIADERTRQVNAEGWTAFHDDSQHYSGELVSAAICYAEAGSGFDLEISPRDGKRPTLWPWEPSSWKPSDDLVRNLVKAGALIAAEIDRVQREDNPDVIAEIPMPASPQVPNSAPPTASDGSQAIGSASKHDYDICAVNEILLASEQRAYRAERRVGDLLQAVGARQSEARQAREAMQSLDVFYVAERERLTASLAALRGALRVIQETSHTLALICPAEVQFGFASIYEMASTALAVSPHPISCVSCGALRGALELIRSSLGRDPWVPVQVIFDTIDAALAVSRVVPTSPSPAAPSAPSPPPTSPATPENPIPRRGTTS